MTNNEDATSTINCQENINMFQPSTTPMNLSAHTINTQET